MRVGGFACWIWAWVLRVQLWANTEAVTEAQKRMNLITVALWSQLQGLGLILHIPQHQRGCGPVHVCTALDKLLNLSGSVSSTGL